MSPGTVYNNEASRRSRQAFSNLSQDIGRNSDFRDSYNKSHFSDKNGAPIIDGYDPNLNYSPKFVITGAATTIKASGREKPFKIQPNYTHIDEQDCET
eukprot:CAMPEP_0185597004 /NCGR_PEP_ID=MMETSP0434-20130131/81094_1 /TAXON_ID=626734 ORGANISM="Favella taraikaensis, Strain Fe Narragansett Bay" /NCGR_SAMPLE_ID=MMETSP0434 /ASSEMBLY_ACC=CAM_ASM_000379 /LENGTH=97 /DNA_ID=CAMNT_0028225615 /DNA_START=1374 /DNA_END=1667 /DNA_ORIENTATION=-